MWKYVSVGFWSEEMNVLYHSPRVMVFIVEQTPEIATNFLCLIGGFVRAEEIIVEIYRRKKEMLSAGTKPAQILLSPPVYRILKEYRKKIGVIGGSVPDYLQADSIFGLEICLHDQDVILIR